VGAVFAPPRILRSFPHLLARVLSAPWRWLLGVFRSRVHGDARWMSRRERQRFLSPENAGIVLSSQYRLSRRDSFTNLALVAPTGSGKTTRYVIPNVLHVQGSVVVTDPSGEIYQRTSGHLQQRGFGIQVLAPGDIARSECFNPLAFWSKPQELRQLATILGMSVQGRQSDPFWATSAVNLLWLSLAALTQVEADRFVNLGNLRWLLNHVGGRNGLDAFMVRHLGHQGPVLAEYRAFCAQDPKVMASILSSARAALELWADVDICRLTSRNTVDIAALRQRPTAIYIVVPEHQIRYFGRLVNLFYSACFSRCLVTGDQEKDLPVYFFLDEFGNLGYVHDVASVITTLRKRRCSVSLILQELSQLRAVYGHDEARTIFSGGCANKLFFAGLDLETALYVEQALGQNTEYDTTFGGIDDRARTLAVPLLRADELRMLRADDAVLISGRQRPVRLPMPPYFVVPSLRELSEVPPPAWRESAAGEEPRFLDLDRGTCSAAGRAQD
jgi:type IV secretory pathway TraG/TraD family ATPase VirD4